MEPAQDTLERIAALKAQWGSRLVLLTHHYQRPEVVRFGDFVGDSFGLAKAAAGTTAERIVFAGVHFMAQSAAILARPAQRVFMPDPAAGYPMAEMADLDDLQVAWDRLERRGTGHTVIPVAYMNSTAEVKAFVGQHEGIVCTSSKARAAMKWARAHGDCVLFLPDEYLGRNTARRMGMHRIAVWNPHAVEPQDEEALARAEVVLWKGYCHVHTLFTAAHVAAARLRYPGSRVLVHPECRPEVIDAADGDGSTTWLAAAVEAAPPGSTLVIGTEVNLIRRLAQRYSDRTVVPLDTSLCPNMYRTSPAKLAHLLETFDPALEIKVDAKVAAAARLALDRMLTLGGGG